MAMLLCPFCQSGDDWNRCTCTFAVIAIGSSLFEARKRFIATGHSYPKRVAVAAPIGVEPRASASTSPESARRTRRSPQTKKRVGDSRKDGTAPDEAAASPAPLKPRERIIQNYAPVGDCGFCDRRRVADQERVRRHRERLAKQKEAR